MKLICNCGREIELGHSESKSDSVDSRREWIENWYRKLGFNISVPSPKVSRDEYLGKKANDKELFYRPATTEVSYEAFMSAVGQSGHWTVTSEADRAKVGWEPAAKGYWQWAEVSQDCPRLKETWHNLMPVIRLLALEEYVIMWHAHKAATGQMLDLRTFSWLRTRCGQGALGADGYGGGVRVDWLGASGLSVPFGLGGGRAAEVVR